MQTKFPAVGDRFEVTRILGEGGMGVVYEALDHERGERIALKTLSENDADWLLRLKREFRALTDLSHPNLVAIYDLFVDAERSFFTMELIDGVDVLRWAGASEDDKRAADIGRLRQALPQIARAIQALHEAEIVHRDIKASNIMVTESGRVVLLDFGVAAEVDPRLRDPSHGDVVGTIDYMSPEQGAGERASFPADWYSFGALLYTALTGRPPFDGTPLQVLLAKIQKTPAPPRDLYADAPEDLSKLAVDLLARTPSDRPTGSEVLRRLGVLDSSRRQTKSSIVGVPFVGRLREFSQLEKVARGLETKATSIALIEGESGIGKSALIAELLVRARGKHPDIVVLRGRCFERESVAYKALDSLIDDLSGYWRALPTNEARSLLPQTAALLPRLFPVLGRVPAIAEADRGEFSGDPREARRRAIAALRETLHILGERVPLLLWVDDMQWVDADSLRLLEDLLRPPNPPQLVLLCTARPSDVQHDDNTAKLLEVLATLGVGTLRIELGPLNRDDSVELAQALLPGELARTAPDVARESQGNPFFLAQLASYMQTVESTGLRPVGLDAVLTARLRKLPDRALRLLQLIGLAAEPLPREVIARAAEAEFDELANDLRMLRIARMIETGGTRRTDYVRPYHDRVTLAVLRGVSDLHTHELHRRLAVALEEWNEAAPERLAHHWRGAGEDKVASSYARRAAEEADNRYDFDRAAALYELAVELHHHHDSDTQRARIARAEALANAGRPVSAAQAFLTAALSADDADGVDGTDGADGANALELRRRSAALLLAGGYIEQGVAAIRDVLGDIGLEWPTQLRPSVLSRISRRAGQRLRGLQFQQRRPSELPKSKLTATDVCWTVASSLCTVDPSRGAGFAERNLRMSLELGEPKRVARAMALSSTYEAMSGHHNRATKLASTAEVVAASARGGHVLAINKLMVGLTSSLQSRFRTALTELDEATARLRGQREAPAFWELDQSQLFAALCQQELGEFSQLRLRVNDYLLEADRRADRYLATGLRTRTSALWIVVGEPERALGESDAAIRSWGSAETIGYHLQHHWARCTRGLVALYTGRFDRVDGVLAEHDALERAGFDKLPATRIEDRFLRGRLLVARALSRPSGDSEGKRYLKRATALARELERDSTLPTATGFAQLLYAAIALEQGSASAAEHLKSGMTTLDRLGAARYGQPVRHILGKQLSGSAGGVLVEESSAWMTRHSVHDPDRFAATVIPNRRRR